MLRIPSIRLVLFYRAHAPINVRNRCRHTPSCSKYTLIALKRFGFIKGWKLGLCRIYRCRPPNGGIDYPPHR
ncbi:membrane protein insertion efficiency factor YidD [Salmonella enterica subsp. salamae]|nr:membrane protein insertion efficiency factor YidD [Salmonella enterica subsp. salamae]ECJ2281275.1 membrane protein insertion efficiency factor YidD [Salmonella enterica subsp. salamae]